MSFTIQLIIKDKVTGHWSYPNWEAADFVYGMLRDHINTKGLNAKLLFIKGELP